MVRARLDLQRDRGLDPQRARIIGKNASQVRAEIAVVRADIQAAIGTGAEYFTGPGHDLETLDRIGRCARGARSESDRPLAHRTAHGGAVAAHRAPEPGAAIVGFQCLVELRPGASGLDNHMAILHRNLANLVQPGKFQRDGLFAGRLECPGVGHAPAAGENRDLVRAAQFDDVGQL